MSLTDIFSTSGWLEARADGGTAEATTITQDAGDTDFATIKDIQGTLEYVNVSVSTQANVLDIIVPITAGDRVTIRKDDDSFHDMMISSTTPRDIHTSLDPFGDGSLVSRFALNDDFTDDLGGASLTGIIAGYVTGQFENAAHFELNTIYYLITPPINFRAVSMWIYRTNTGGTYDRYIMSGLTNDGTFIVELLDGTDVLYWFDCFNVRLNNISVALNTPIGYNVWNHLYFEVIDYQHSDGLFIGNNVTDSTRRVFGGYIDNIEFFRRRMTVDEIDMIIARQAGVHIDTTDITEGEIPSKAYLTKDNIKFNTDSGYVVMERKIDNHTLTTEAGVEIVGTAICTTEAPTLFLSDAILGAQAGDMAYVMWCQDSVQAEAVTGWTFINLNQAGLGGGVYYKELTSSDVSWPGFGLTLASVTMLVCRGASTAAPTYSTISGSPGMPNCPTLSGFSVGDLVLAVGFQDDDHTTPIAQIGYTLGAYMWTSAWGSSCMFSTKTCEVAGDETPGIFTGNTDDYWTATTLKIVATGNVEKFRTTRTMYSKAISGRTLAPHITLPVKGDRMYDLTFNIGKAP